jgi:hypothetical protein
MNAPELTGGKQAASRFQPGQSGNPGGRPIGARNKLSEDFVRAVASDFAQHGAAVIESVRKDKPDVYLKVIAGLVPQKLDLDGRVTFASATKEQRDAAVAAASRADS